MCRRAKAPEHAQALVKKRVYRQSDADRDIFVQRSKWSVTKAGQNAFNSSTDWSSVSGSEPPEDQAWVRRDVAKAEATVRSRISQAVPAARQDQFEYVVSVTEDSGALSASDSTGEAHHVAV